MDQQIAGSSRKKMAGAPQSVFFLPDEMVFEILSLLEVESVLRCKCVCKHWYALIQLKEFADMRWKRGRCVAFKCEGERTNFDGSKETYRYICYCDGLLLERRLSSTIPSANYRISNPSTKQIVDLPDPHEIVVKMSIYLHSSTGSYKVVSVLLEEESRNIRFDVLDIIYGPNEVLTWRTLKISDFHNITRDDIGSFYFKIPIISTKGIVYLCRIRKEGLSDAELICIDLDKEVSTTYTASRSFFNDWENVKFMLWNDMPSVLGFMEEIVVVWVLEDYEKQKWADTKMAISSTCLKNFPDWKKVLPIFSRKGGEDVITFRDNVAGFEYHIRSKKWCEIPIDVILELPETFLTIKRN